MRSVSPMGTSPSVNWQHYDLGEKWNRANALVFGRRLRVRTDELRSTYDGHYESDSPAYSIALWPIGDAHEGWTPSVLGAGDLYFDRDDGQNRERRFAPYPLKELRREEAGFRAVEEEIVREGWSRGEHIAGADDVSPEWLVVGKDCTLFFGVLMKPGKVPKELPDGLAALRATGSSGKMHPRTLVGAWLVDTGDAALASFDPTDARVKQAERDLKSAFPKQKDRGFVLLPSDAAWTTSSASRPRHDQAPRLDRAPHDHWRQRFEELWGPLEEDGSELFSKQFSGTIHRLSRDDLGDPLETWYRFDDFSFTDAAADTSTWKDRDTTLIELDIEQHGESHHRAVAAVRVDETAYLLIISNPTIPGLRELLGLRQAVEQRETITLGFG